MQIDLNKLTSENEYEYHFEENIIFDKKDLSNVEILDIKKCSVKGFIKKYNEELYCLNLEIKGQMILECAISLEEVNYPFKINIEKTFDINEEDDENLKINANLLDIFPFIWENIVLEKPARVVKENNKAITSGTGWSLTEEKEAINNSQLSELNKLLDMEEKNENGIKY